MQFPEFDPIALSIGPFFGIGPLQIHWYAISYLVAFAIAWFLAMSRAKKPDSGWTSEQVSDLLFYGYLGVILGGRIGYVLFYHFDFFLADPLYLFKVWNGGMSFHGGLLGVIAGVWWFARKSHKSFWHVADFVVPIVPLGLGSGRLGNFINGELWGRAAPADLPWAMRFPHDREQLLRHPSQLYEFLLEGILLFIIVWWFSNKKRPNMAVSALFLTGYGTFRFLVEFFREPDAHLGKVISWLTMGQLLSAPMIIIGIWLLYYAYKNDPVSKHPTSTKA